MSKDKFMPFDTSLSKQQMKWLRLAAPLGLGIGAVAGIMLYQPRLARRWLAKTAPNALFYVDTSQHIAAMTIDDGPHPVVTPRILDVLAQHQAKATFFLLGSRIPGNEAIVERIVAEGHELGNHTMFDVPSIGLSEAQFEAELLQAHEILSQFSQVHWFRPGSGWFNRRMLEQASGLGYRCVIGSIYPYDAHLPFTPILSAYVLVNIFPGAIIALHDGEWRRRKTVTILQQILPRLQRRGYRVVTLSELVAAEETSP
ncbi:MAG: polysaccharide deacetylase family protein [Chloroflexi bacterium]|nr:polysaccharide deacetylase family protein [Chloroflexota bacterium]